MMLYIYIYILHTHTHTHTHTQGVSIIFLELHSFTTKSSLRQTWLLVNVVGCLLDKIVAFVASHYYLPSLHFILALGQWF